MINNTKSMNNIDEDDSKLSNQILLLTSYCKMQTKEDCLMLSQASGGMLQYRGTVPPEDKDFHATLESHVVGDWLEALGGPNLQEHVFRVFAKDLETESLADIRQRIERPNLRDSLPQLRSNKPRKEQKTRPWVSHQMQKQFSKQYCVMDEAKPSSRSSTRTNTPAGLQAAP
jgi:hypothetical protein